MNVFRVTSVAVLLPDAWRPARQTCLLQPRQRHLTEGWMKGRHPPETACQSFGHGPDAVRRRRPMRLCLLFSEGEYVHCRKG